MKVAVKPEEDAEPLRQSLPTGTRDPHAVVAFTFATLLMVIPIEAGLLDPLLQARRFGPPSLVAAGFFAVVFLPFFFAVRRWRQEHSMYRGRNFLVATGVILTLNLVWLAFVLVYQLVR
jgi:hypothetical protein